MVPYAATTNGITVTVRPIYLDNPTDVMAAKFVFGYLVRIANDGVEEAQLLRRHWFIRDSNGHVEEVEGEGVVGEQPVIPPGAYYEYSSYCVLATFEGSMEGTFLMQRADGDRFKILIPRFDLCAAGN